MLPAGEMWSVVTLSPKMPSARAPLISSISPGFKLKLREERRLLNVSALRVPFVNVAGARRNFVPLRILRGEIAIKLAENFRLQRRLHLVANFLQRRPEVLQENRLAVLSPARAVRWLRSMSTRPASANATTSGGDMRKFALML